MTKRRSAWRLLIATLLCGALLCVGWPQPGYMSVYELLRPLEPGQPIPDVTGGYVLGEPEPGHERDIVLVARKGSQRVEVHLLDRDRWQEATHTPSFDVGYEGFGSNAPPPECDEVTAAIAAAVRANDPGGLRIEMLSRRDSTPTRLERVLDRWRDGRGLIAGAVLVGLVVTVVGLPLGELALGLLLVALGLWLRATRLDLPFQMDADVQRLFTARLGLLDLFDSAVFHDRHPPLGFVLIHLAQTFGQSECVGRLPAVLAGALVGPSILGMTRWFRLRETSSRDIASSATLAACAALAATFCPLLIERSREVGELALTGLLAVVTVAAVLRACRDPNRATLCVVALGHALLLWTYYLAVFLLIGFWLALRFGGRINRRVVVASAAGSLLGSPSLAFGALVLLRDYPLRQIATTFPQIVWGDHAIGGMAGEIAFTLISAVGLPLAAVLLSLVVVSVVQRKPAMFAPVAATVAVGLGMLLLVKPARIQPYYIVSALPLLYLALALFELPVMRLRRWLIVGGVVLATAATVPQQLARSADRLYAPSSHAFGQRFARLISSRAESRIAVVFAPDGTLLAYYLARVAGVEVDWNSLHTQPNSIEIDGLRQHLFPLVQQTAAGEDLAKRAVAVLDGLAGDGGFLAVADTPAAVPEIAAWLERCEELEHTPVRRLLYCAKRS